MSKKRQKCTELSETLMRVVPSFASGVGGAKNQRREGNFKLAQSVSTVGNPAALALFCLFHHLQAKNSAAPLLQGGRDHTAACGQRGEVRPTGQTVFVMPRLRLRRDANAA